MHENDYTLRASIHRHQVVKGYMMAKAINSIVVNSTYQMDGEHWLVTNCADYDTWKALPAGVQFEGRRYGKTGWNSDLCTACYSTGRAFATY